MKKYLVIFSVMMIFSCTNSKKAEEMALEEKIQADEQRQNTIDSMEVVNAEIEANSQSGDNYSATPVGHGVSEEAAPTADVKKKMNNKTKGALIDAGAGVVGGAITGAAVSKKKGKGAIVGGIVGGAVGAGVGYGIGAKKDNRDTIK